MSRAEAVAVVESFLDCIARKELDRLPIHPDLTVESPMIPKLSGQAAMKYLRTVAAAVSAIRVFQHIVEGDHVATFFEEETVNGPLPVFSKFELAGGRVKDVRVFYDARRLAQQS